MLGRAAGGQPPAGLPDPARLLRPPARLHRCRRRLAGRLRRGRRRSADPGASKAAIRSPSRPSPTAQLDRPAGLLADRLRIRPRSPPARPARTEPAASPSPVREAVVSLPEGMTINPSVGAGLGVCTPAQYAAETASSPPGAGCPNDSKIGDFTVESPLFEEALEGADLPRPALREPLRLADRRLPGRQGAGARRSSSRSPGELDADPSHGPPHRALRRPAPAPLHPPADPLPRRPARAAGHPGGLRRLPDRRSS